MLKIFQARFQQYVNWELLDVQAGFGKGRETTDQIDNICYIIEKTREFQDIYFCNIYICFCFMVNAKAFDCVHHKKTVGNSESDGNTRLPYLHLRNQTCMQVKKEQLEPYMEQWTVQSWERSTSRLYIVTLLI